MPTAHSALSPTHPLQRGRESICSAFQCSKIPLPRRPQQTNRLANERVARRILSSRILVAAQLTSECYPAREPWLNLAADEYCCSEQYQDLEDDPEWVQVSSSAPRMTLVLNRAVKGCHDRLLKAERKVVLRSCCWSDDVVVAMRDWKHYWNTLFFILEKILYSCGWFQQSCIVELIEGYSPNTTKLSVARSTYNPKPHTLACAAICSLAR